MKPMPDVRYQHFTFPLAILYDELQKLVAEPPSLTLDPTEKERRNRLLAWLQENALRRPDEFGMSYEDLARK